MEGKSLIALASLAGQTVVDAAAADEWETAQRRFALVLGRGDAKQILLAEQRLEETREQLSRRFRDRCGADPHGSEDGVDGAAGGLPGGESGHRG